MSDSEKQSKDGEAEKEPVFYYSREHRLERASARVRAFNSENPEKRSIAKTLFGTKSNALILMSILIICAMYGFTSRSSSRGTNVQLGANSLNLTVIREEETLGLRIIKAVPKSGEFYIGAVDIVVSPVIAKLEEGEEPQVFRHRIFFNPTESESFFVSLPFDDSDFYVFLSADDEQKVMRVNSR